MSQEFFPPLMQRLMSGDKQILFKTNRLVLETVYTDSVIHRGKQIPNGYVVCEHCSVCRPADVFPCSQRSLSLSQSLGQYSFCSTFTESIMPDLKVRD
jgi:hypothetical protein